VTDDASTDDVSTGAASTDAASTGAASTDDASTDAAQPAIAAHAPSGSAQPAVHLVLALVQVAFASLAVAGKLAMREVPSQGLALVRIGGAALAFLVWRRLRGPFPRIALRDLALLTLCAVLGIAGNQLLFLAGLARTTATNASVLSAAIPVLTVAAAVVLGREKLVPRLAAGLALACAGMLWLVGADGFRLEGGTLVGDLLIVVNASAYATYLVIVREPIARLGADVVVPVVFGIGAVLTLPFGMAPLASVAPGLGLSAWLLLLYVVLVPTIFTYGANAWALARAPSSLVAVYIYAQPVCASLLAFFFLDERPAPRAYVAAALVFAGIALATSTRRAR